MPIITQPIVEVNLSDFGSVKQLKSMTKKKKVSSEHTEEY